MSLGQVQNSLRLAVKRIEGRTQEGVHAAAEFFLARMIPRAPIKTGALRLSGRVEDAGTDAKPAALITFRVPYALRVHEDLRARHKIGQAKFAESVLIEDRAEGLRRIAVRARGGV